MPAAERISLWALPSASDRDVYRPWIRHLARNVKNEFEPHITFFESIPSERSAAAAIGRVASETEPFTAELTDTRFTGKYFRCVVLIVRPEGPIVNLRNRLIGRLKESSVGDWDASTEDYCPHLSLLYGTLTADERERARANIDLTLPARLLVDAMCLVNTSKGNARDWPTLETWPLRRDGPQR
jgi:hypothetical protein